VNTPRSRVLAAGAVLAALGVALGAFGAHGLRSAMDADALRWWETAVQYQMWHAIGLIALGTAPLQNLDRPAALLGAGALIFSGTLYLMALTGARWLGMITPVGGALMIAGWTWVVWCVWRNKKAGQFGD
jgi:uncharacterized membrane protein YgdD (TMEM256/DUF423 family)